MDFATNSGRLRGEVQLPVLDGMLVTEPQQVAFRSVHQSKATVVTLGILAFEELLQRPQRRTAGDLEWMLTVDLDVLEVAIGEMVTT